MTGEHCFTLTVTDICTGWTVNRSVAVVVEFASVAVMSPRWATLGQHHVRIRPSTANEAQRRKPALTCTFVDSQRSPTTHRSLSVCGSAHGRTAFQVQRGRGSAMWGIRDVPIRRAPSASRHVATNSRIGWRLPRGNPR